MGGFCRLVATEETVQVKVNPQAAMIGGNVFVKRVVPGGQDGHVRRRKDTVNWIPTEVPLVSGLMGPWVFGLDCLDQSHFAHRITERLWGVGGQVIVGIDAQDDGTAIVAPVVDCHGEVLDESLPWFCVAVGAAEMGLVLEPHGLMPIVWWVWSVCRNDHQVSLANASCSALKSNPGSSPQAIVATGPDSVRYFVEGRSRTAPKLGGRMGRPWLMGVVGHRRVETFALPSHGAGSFTPSVGWCNCWPEFVQFRQ
ncbi:unnamed protein product [Cylindrotheca closterium]|uniref:Uncharacterized protein n=1 Tax=Cylindrotheca closterium TaxID=2856 RepID=A0AAD2CKQ8_9STRA|nr:unnamed protein product [Cylindrotheca closterium]